MKNLNTNLAKESMNVANCKMNVNSDFKIRNSPKHENRVLKICQESELIDKEKMMRLKRGLRIPRHNYNIDM